MGLRGVFENQQPAFLGKLTYRLHIRKAAIQVHRQNPTRFRRARCLEPLRVHIESLFVRLHEHRHKSRSIHGQHRRNVRIRRNQNLVARSQTL